MSLVSWNEDCVGNAIEQSVILKLTFIHFIILLQKNEILQSLLKDESNYQSFLETVSLKQKQLQKALENGKYTIEEDGWIHGANCLHLAAKFNHKGMEYILSNIKEKAKFISDTHKDGTITPLHIAASKLSSRATE